MRPMPLGISLATMLAFAAIEAAAAEPDLANLRTGMTRAEAERALRDWGERQPGGAKLNLYRLQVSTPEGGQRGYATRLQASVQHDAPLDGFTEEVRTVHFSLPAAGTEEQQVVTIVRDLRAGADPQTLTVAQMRSDLQAQYGPQGLERRSGAWTAQDWHYERTAVTERGGRIAECAVAREGEEFRYRAGCGIAVRAEMRAAADAALGEPRGEATARVDRLIVTMQDHDLGARAMVAHGEGFGAGGWVAETLRRADPTIVDRPQE